MKRALILASLATLLIASAGYAPCYYPLARHTDYYQYHSSCSPCGPREPMVEYWSLDGTCDLDCDGNTYCEGDTEVRARTYTYSSFSGCDPICD